jgi:hypothetical protein
MDNTIDSIYPITPPSDMERIRLHVEAGNTVLFDGVSLDDVLAYQIFKGDSGAQRVEALKKEYPTADAFKYIKKYGEQKLREDFEAYKNAVGSEWASGIPGMPDELMRFEDFHKNVVIPEIKTA